MTKHKTFKASIRARMVKTGESFVTARLHSMRNEPDTTRPPKGWFVAGMAPSDYAFAVDRGQYHSCSSSAVVRSRVEKPRDFGTLMQQIRADAYRGGRVRLTGWVKTDRVDGWCGLWLRVDAPEGTIALDNMSARPIKGTQPWTRHELVLEAPTHASVIAFGILLHGKGAAWLDDVTLERVDESVPTTHTEYLATTPANLDFEG